MREPVARGALAVLAVLAAACGGTTRPSTTSGSPHPLSCAAPLEAPPGFEQTERFEEEYPDHVGVRIGFRDGAGREVHAFGGIRGEFGEGMPRAGSLTLAAGGEAWLAGEGDVWVAGWQTDEPCGEEAVLGSGFSREEFVSLLVDAGLVSGQPE